MEPKTKLVTKSRLGTRVSFALHAAAAAMLFLAPVAADRPATSASPPVRVVVLSLAARRKAPLPPAQQAAGTPSRSRGLAHDSLAVSKRAAPPAAGAWEDPPVPKNPVPDLPLGPATPRLPEPGPRFGDVRMALAGVASGAPAGGSGFAAVGVGTPAPRHDPAGATGGFATARAAAPAAQIASAPISAPVSRPVEILAKPVPRYTEAARSQGIEGEVWIEAFFPSEGAAEVRRVLRGLGYGLDEEARRCVSQVRFRPAERDGVRIDAIATLRIAFELADSPAEKPGGAAGGPARSHP